MVTTADGTGDADNANADEIQEVRNVNEYDDQARNEMSKVNDLDSGQGMRDRHREDSRTDPIHRHASSSPATASSPAKDSSPATTSLGKRAPTGPIPVRTWRFYLNHPIGRYEYLDILEQRNQCIRSRLAHISHDYKATTILEAGLQTIGFPYPAKFLHFLESREAQDQHHDLRDRERGVDDPGTRKTSVHENDGVRDVEAGGASTPARGDQITQGPEFKFETSLFGISWTSAITSETRVQPAYVVLGVFPRGHSNPLERVVFCHEPEHLFRQLHWEVFRLRGFWRTFFSLRHVKGFRLYKCNVEDGTHGRVNLDSNGVADLQLLLHTYKKWRVPKHMALAWANWIHEELNNGSHDVLKGEYALELVLDWSVARITVVILIPVLLSLAIGLWFNSKAWTDLTTISTAWAIASYVVTAGGFVAALLGFVSNLADK